MIFWICKKMSLSLKRLTYLGMKYHDLYSVVSNGSAKNTIHIFIMQIWQDSNKCWLQRVIIWMITITNFLYAWNCFIIKGGGGGAERLESANFTREKIQQPKTKAVGTVKNQTWLHFKHLLNTVYPFSSNKVN